MTQPNNSNPVTTRSTVDLGPLDWRVPIVNKGGIPTAEFQQKWVAQRNNNGLISTVTVGTTQPTDPVPSDGNEYVNVGASPPELFVASSGSWVRVGVVNFTDLADVPHTYVANDVVQVNSAGSGLQFSTASHVLDTIGSTEGDVLYRGLTSWTALPPGTSGQVLTTGGSGSVPSWSSPAASGVTSVTAGTGLTGGTITSTGTIAIGNTSVTPGSYTSANITVNAQGQVTAASNGSGGGGGTTPTIRSHSSGIWNSSSVTVPLPTGTVVGDVVFVYWENGFSITTSPAGWVPIYVSNNGSNFVNQALAAKIMTSADITTGSVTVTASNSFNGVWFILALVGSTAHSFTSFSHFDSAGGGSVPSVAVIGLEGVPSTNLLFGFFSTRSSSTQTIMPSSGLTVLDTQNSVPAAAGISFTINPASLGFFGVNETITLPVSNNGGDYVIVACG